MMRNFRIVKIVLIGSLLCFSAQIIAANANNSKTDEVKDTSHFLTDHSDLQLTFLFPVINDKVNLKVIIPKTFKALEADPNAELLEFIPKTDTDSYKWSEIITLNKILGSGISAEEYIDKLNDLFLHATDNTAKIIQKDKHSYDGYQDATSIIQYHFKGRNEVVILYSVSGPLDIANVQYALPLSSPDKLDETVKKLKDFIKDNIEIVKK